MTKETAPPVLKEPIMLHRPTPAKSPWRLLPLVALAVLVAGSAVAAELPLHIQLIWGTNGEKPKEGPPLKDVDAKLKERLTAVFKWQHYYEVHQTNITVAEKQVRKVKIDKPCDIEIHNLGNSLIEVKLFGKGEKVFTSKAPLKDKEPVVLAGPDKNDTAWFVVLTPK